MDPQICILIYKWHKHIEYGNYYAQFQFMKYFPSECSTFSILCMHPCTRAKLENLHHLYSMLGQATRNFLIHSFGKKDE